MKKMNLFETRSVDRFRKPGDDKIFVFYQSDGLEDLQHEVDPDGVVTRRSDVSVLLNQKLLEKRNVSPLAIQNFVDAFRKKSTNDLLKNQPDNVLMEVVRSRYIQSPADVWRYNYTIEHDLVGLEEDIQRVVKEREEQAKESTVEEPVDKSTTE